MRFLLIWIFVKCAFVEAQTLSYSPGLVIEKTVSLNYYNTEYIFITNNGGQPVELSFELLSEDLPAAWSATGCTNLICYTKIPDDGQLGVIAPGNEAYVSINLSVNETAGDGELKFVVFAEATPEIRDTISFIYHAENDTLAQEPQPWAKINFAQNVVTVFLLNESIETTLTLFDLRGNEVAQTKLEKITALSVANLQAGIYIAVVRSSTGKMLSQKIVKI
jgi:hypothetical protein